jgi:DNA-binding NtrC family response regulator
MTEQSKPVLLIIEDTKNMRDYLARTVHRAFPHVEIVLADTLERAKAQLDGRCVDVALTDIQYPISGNKIDTTAGLQFISWARENKPQMRCVAMTTEMTSEIRNFCMRNNVPVYDKLNKLEQNILSFVGSALDRAVIVSSPQAASEAKM